MIIARQREVEATDLRIAGMDVAEIAHQMGMSESGVSGAITRTLERYRKHTRENAQELLELELKRCDQMMKAVYFVAIGAIVDRSMSKKIAIELCLKIMKRRDKLSGLEHTIEFHATMNVTPEALEQLREKRWGRIEKHVASLLDAGEEGGVIEGEFKEVEEKVSESSSVDLGGAGVDENQ